MTAPKDVTAKDVAAYILRKLGQMSSMKLQKLSYYAQAYSLAWFNEPIFDDQIEAWTNGPVIPALWREHKGQFMVEEIPGGNADVVLSRDALVVDSIIDSMGGLSGKQLSDRTHSESPWIKNYDGDDRYPNTTIPHTDMHDFYKA
jgi:uncharacterized phage-associated protein